MERSIFITVYVPTVFLHIDVSITINMKVIEALELLYKIIRYQIDDGRSFDLFTIMYDAERNIILPLQETIQQVGLVNGSRIFVI